MGSKKQNNEIKFFNINLSESPKKAPLLIFLSESAVVDYYCYRNMFLTGDIELYFFKLIKTAGDFIEKILKCFLLSFDESINLKGLGHNSEKIRFECSKIDAYFNNFNFKLFCEQYSQASNRIDGHQIFGYSDMSVFNGGNVDFKAILDLIDELILEVVARTKNGNGFIYYNFIGIYVWNMDILFRHTNNLKRLAVVRDTYFKENKSIHPFYLKYEDNFDRYHQIKVRLSSRYKYPEEN